MIRKILFELLFLILACFLAILLMVFLTFVVDSRNTFGFRVFDNSIEMPVELMLLFFWLIVVFIMNLIRQFKLRFTSYFSNVVLIASGLILMYFLNEFIFTAVNIRKMLKAEKLTEKVKYCDYEIFLFRGIEISIALLMVVVIIKTIQKLRVHSA